MPYGWHIPRVFLWLSLALTFSTFFWVATYEQPVSLLHHSNATPNALSDNAYFSPAPELCSNGPQANHFCDSFPQQLLADVQVTVKTGIGERPKLEALLSSYASCIPNLLIVSDVTGNVHGHQVHDILGDLPSSYADNNTDWAAYEAQQENLAAGNTASKTPGGWKLDRFKFLPMVEYAHAQNPHAKWYVFIEPDTYLFWDTLFRVLEKLDSDEPHYLGTATPGSYNRWFAYGGSGFVLSQGMLKNLTLQGDRRLSSKYEWLAKDDCCGDAVLAYVLYAELEARVGNMYPTFLGDEPQWVWASKENWCTPLLSLHRLNAEQLASLWNWERCRNSSDPDRPITFATFLNWGLGRLLEGGRSTKSHWNNGADIELSKYSGAHSSAAACFTYCRKKTSCLQASFSEKKCRFSKGVRLGQADEKDIESMWDLEKLESLGWRPGAANVSASCSRIDWVTPDILLPSKDWLQSLGLKQWPYPPVPSYDF